MVSYWCGGIQLLFFLSSLRSFVYAYLAIIMNDVLCSNIWYRQTIHQKIFTAAFAEGWVIRNDVLKYSANMYVRFGGIFSFSLHFFQNIAAFYADVRKNVYTEWISEGIKTKANSPIFTLVAIIDNTGSRVKSIKQFSNNETYEWLYWFGLWLFVHIMSYALTRSNFFFVLYFAHISIVCVVLEMVWRLSKVTTVLLCSIW